MGKSKAARERVIGEERSRAALELRKTGASYVEIGKQLGITDEGARKATHRALARLIEKTNEVAEEVRRIELERLDVMLKALWPKVETGDTRAIGVALKIQVRRAKLLGLDAPEKKTLEVSGGLSHRVFEPYTTAQLEQVEQTLRATIEAEDVPLIEAGEGTTT